MPERKTLELAKGKQRTVETASLLAAIIIYFHNRRNGFVLGKRKKSQRWVKDFSLLGGVGSDWKLIGWIGRKGRVGEGSDQKRECNRKGLNSGGKLRIS